MTDDELGALGITRRSFFKKMVAVGFAVPIISSFTLDGVASAVHEHQFHYGNQTQNHYPFPNQFQGYMPNQTQFPFPNQFQFPFPNQTHV